MKLKKIISNFIFLSIAILNFSILNIQVYATEEEFIEEKTQISKEKIQYKKYSKDGQYSLEGVLLNGKKEGLWTEFNNGDIIRYRHHKCLKISKIIFFNHFYILISKNKKSIIYMLESNH